MFILQSSAQGTVPYLGIFLTDLTMLDAAVKDRLEVRHAPRTPSDPTSLIRQPKKNQYNSVNINIRFSSERLHQLRQTATSEFYSFLVLLCFIFSEVYRKWTLFFAFSSLKEFEVLAKIRLLQLSCRNSTFRTDESFVHWYHSVPALTVEER